MTFSFSLRANAALLLRRIFSCLFIVGSLSFTRMSFAEEAPAEEGAFFHAKSPEIPSDLEEAQTIHRQLFPFLAEFAHDSVVNIVSEGEEEALSDEEKALQEAFPFFRGEPGEPIRSLGSGFVIHEDGYIATNAHVVSHAKRILVRLPDDRKDYDAKLIGADEKTDIALIKVDIPDKKLRPLPVGDSHGLEVGESVLAIGYQFQLGQSVTAGVVSATSRKIPSRIIGPYDQFIQTDASINPGSSGGPLMNVRGEVIGINTAIFSPGRQSASSPGFNIGIGFAIPMNQAKKVLLSLKRQGKVTRGMLGVVIQEVTPEIAKLLNLPDARGALVADVMKDSPAERAGFQRRDIIVRFGSSSVRDHDDLPLLVAETEIGSQIETEVLRAGKAVILRPTIAELQDTSKPTPSLAEDRMSFDRIGLRLVEEAKSKGLLVKAVRVGSPAFLAGIQRGDRVLELNEKSIGDIGSYTNSLSKLKAGETILLLVEKKEGTRFLTLEVTKEKGSEEGIRK